jgi:hypothetical protein
MSDFLDALKVGRRTAKSWAKSAGGPKELTATLSLPVLKGVITYIRANLSPTKKLIELSKA